MSLAAIFINPETRLLRSGWRLLVFAALTFPLWFPEKGGEATASTFKVNWGMVSLYVVLVIWVVMASWLCLKFLDRLSLSALGLTWHHGWGREVLLGCAVSTAM